jgi:hypothetical protein
MHLCGGEKHARLFNFIFEETRLSQVPIAGKKNSDADTATAKREVSPRRLTMGL